MKELKNRALVLLLLALQLPPLSAQAANFDLEARKERLPWIWQTPHRQNLPPIKNQAWPTTDIDYFVLAKLEEKRLSPAPPTDEITWLRRVHFAITGLPPTADTIQRFLSFDPAKRRERLVDLLLASPHFGERWARHWMDLVRYAESRGHESDFIIPNAYHYRDYLVRAFNADLPYNQFVKEHVAGDLLSSPRLDPATGANESVLATGWPFLGEENHSPVDIRQDECERTDNKVDVFSKTFLGLTVACARCHDHKFDAITSKDYYGLAGFILSSSYRQVPFESMERNRQVAAELEKLREEFGPKLARATAETIGPGIGETRNYLEGAKRVLRAAQPANDVPVAESTARDQKLDAQRLKLWVQELRGAAAQPLNPFHVWAKAVIAGETNLAANSQPHESLHLSPQAKIIADFSRPDGQPWKVDGPGFGNAPITQASLFFLGETNSPLIEIANYGSARRDLFWKKLKTAPGNENDPGSLAATSRSGQTLATPTFTIQGGKLHYLLKGKARVYAAVDSHIMIAGPLHGSLTKGFDSGVSPDPVWVTHDLSAYNGQRAHIEFGPEGESPLEVLMVVESPEKPAAFPALQPQIEAASIEQHEESLQGLLVRACAELKTLTPEKMRIAESAAPFGNWLLQHRGLFVLCQNDAVSEIEAEFLRRQEALSRKAKWESKTAVAWFDGTGVDENILVRGKPFRPGAVAPRSLPAAFVDAHPVTSRNSSGRLELAEQLTDPANPLVARVMVNRVWHHLFGRGIVSTVDNFGYLGERPTHPELLDHLAWQFVHEDGWSVKSLIKRLVLSRTFAMSSNDSDRHAAEVDPSNLLLHRANLRRLEAETIRDSVLVVSGRFDPAIGGPPVPIYLTDFVVGRGRPEKSGPLDGAGRRSIYLAARRNFLPTMAIAFDLPTPCTTAGRRNVTNVPAQSLALMNDDFIYDQARVWAERLLRETQGKTNEERIARCFQDAFGRMPEPFESRASVEELEELKQACAKAEGVELWKEFCHALLNANDFIYVK